MRRSHLLSACLALVALGSAPTGAQAVTETAWWHLDATAAPSTLSAGHRAQIVVTASNLGDAVVEATSEDQLELSDVLPAGVAPVAVLEKEGVKVEIEGCGIVGQKVTCRYPKSRRPYEVLSMRIEVQTKAPTEPAQIEELANEVKIEGGTIAATGAEMPAASLAKPLKVATAGSAAVPFGVESYALAPETETGAMDTQAGSHPFQLTTTFDLNQTLATYSAKEEKGEFPSAPALPRDLHFELPHGFIGYPDATPRCSETELTVNVEPFTDLCPGDTAVGMATVIANIPAPLGLEVLTVPVFNVEPAVGEPARLGFFVKGVPVVIRTALPAGGDRGVEATVEYASEAAQVLATQLTLWGVPDDPRHDGVRGWECFYEGVLKGRPCEPKDENPPKAFLTMPSDCSEPLTSSVTGDSWPAGASVPSKPLVPPSEPATLPQLEGCQSLTFDPTVPLAETEAKTASTPTGFDFDVHMDQPGLLEAEGRAEPPLKETTVALPAGLELNPKAANGLEACSALDFWGFSFANEAEQTDNELLSPGPAGCPDAAKVGTVTASTPLLPNELKGSVYLAAQNTNPFGDPLALYLTVEDPVTGVRVKLAGEVNIASDGQVTTTFRNIPQVGLFRELKLHLFGGERASLSTPDFCGAYPVDTTFTPWSGEPAAQPPAAFAVTSGPGGGACPSAPLPFSLGHTIGPESPRAGAYSNFDVDLDRPDGQQSLDGLSVKLPPGYAAVLKDVTPCPEPPAGREWTCGGESEIGAVKVASGLGAHEPVELTGQAYLTSGYDGAPFGLLVRTLANTGPFELGYVDVRSRINVDPHTASVTVTSDPGPRGEGVPTRLKGVPVQIKRIEVAVNRPNFEFNPTNCSTMNFEVSLDGAELDGPGTAVDSFASPFAVTECPSLSFAPKLTAYASGKASKANGVSLTVKVEGQGLGAANIAKTVLVLPATLPARLTTIQKACVDATFEHNPASCPEGSVIGKGIARSPVLRQPLEGPAYLVSHGGAAWPDVEFVLKGEDGIELVLDGQTAIKKGVTTSTFDSVPDDPIESFEAILPEGPHSALTTNVPAKDKYSLCTTKAVLPTTLTGQNGKVIEQQTKLQVLGCGEVEGYQANLLKQFKKAMAKCHSKYKHAKAKRAKCERTARAHYSALALAQCRKTEKHSKKKLAACEASMRVRYGVKKPAHKAKKAKKR